MKRGSAGQVRPWRKLVALTVRNKRGRWSRKRWDFEATCLRASGRKDQTTNIDFLYIHRECCSSPTRTGKCQK